MKKISFLLGLILLFAYFSCTKEDNILYGNFEFTKEYLATVTVGGVVGITERTFEIGEVYSGSDDGGNLITIRIAQHTDINDDCPNSWCYQEFLDVPREYLKFIQ